MAAPAISTLRTAVKAVLDAAVPAGTKTHSYFRLSTTDAAMRAQMLSTDDRLHAWMVSLSEAATITGVYRGSSQEQFTVTFALHGWMAVNDADETELLWCDEVDDVMQAFRDTPRLNLTEVIEAGPIAAATIGYRNVPPKAEGILTHYALLTYPVRVQARP